jgi:hypothetical protein
MLWFIWSTTRPRKIGDRLKYSSLKNTSLFSFAEWDQHASLRVIALIFFTSLLASVCVYTCDKKQALANCQPEDHFATLIYSIPYGWRLRLMFNWVCKMKLLFLTTARGEHNCKLFVTKCVQLTPFMHVCLLYRYAKRLVHLPHTSLLVKSLQPAGTNIYSLHTDVA